MINPTSLRQSQLPQSQLPQPQWPESQWPQISWVVLRQSLLAEPTSGLLKFVTVLVIISALTCVYVWQASTISDIDSATAAMQAQALELERQNARLMLQVAQWNAPAYIEGKAQGMVPGQQPVYVEVPELASASPGARTTAHQNAQQLWQRLTGWLPTRAALAFAIQ